jgi:hypothetical protein
VEGQGVRVKASMATTVGTHDVVDAALVVKAMQESKLISVLLVYFALENAELTREAADVFIWCLMESPESYKQWVSNLLLVCLCSAVHKLVVTEGHLTCDLNGA